jgi:hypothetical protein
MAARDFCIPRPGFGEWEHPSARERVVAQWSADERTERLMQYLLGATTNRPTADDAEAVPERFRRLADEWSMETMHISSASDLINDKRYQKIIDLGWDVVPYLLKDLQTNKRFWFPALAAITGVRPFDTSEINNPRRMTEAWVKWGRWKGLI